jgi:hypothetical protein
VVLSALTHSPSPARRHQEMEAATAYYDDDPDVSGGATRLRRLHEAASGQTATQLPKGLTEDAVCEALNVYFDVSIAVMRRLVDDVEARGQVRESAASQCCGGLR